MSRRILALALSALLCPAPAGDDPAPRIGAVAPAPAVSAWLDGGPPVELGRGRAQVLVFWATWCSPCLAEFPRLNELVEALVGEPLDFVSITDEPRAAVEALLVTRPLRTRVALDEGGRTFAAYGVRVRPRIVLVAPDGRVAALPHAEELEVGRLRALAAGEALELAEAQLEPADLERDRGKAALDAAASLGHVWIERSRAVGGGAHVPPGEGRLTADGVGFRPLVELAFDVGPFQLLGTHPALSDATNVYRVSVKAPDGRAATMRAMLAEQLQRIVPFQAAWQEREETVAVLRRAGALAGGLGPSTAVEESVFARRGRIRLARVPFERVVAMLELYGIQAAIEDDTGLAGEHDLELDWTPGDRRSFRLALRAVGLELGEELRSVRRLVVSP